MKVSRFLPEDEHTRLLGEGHLKKLDKGQYLAYQGEVWPNVMLVISGKMRGAMLATLLLDQYHFHRYSD